MFTYSCIEKCSESAVNITWQKKWSQAGHLVTKFATNAILSCHGKKTRGEGGLWKSRNLPNKAVGNKTWFCKILYFWELDDKLNAQVRKPHACVKKRSNKQEHILQVIWQVFSELLWFYLYPDTNDSMGTETLTPQTNHADACSIHT